MGFHSHTTSAFQSIDRKQRRRLCRAISIDVASFFECCSPWIALDATPVRTTDMGFVAAAHYPYIQKAERRLLHDSITNPLTPEDNS